ncbi:protein of unknown function [Nitrospira defluvii]|uniref:Uncharacterized protein n=1 Tax=Nitrospira defluvii TaxID=330214 RepID=D8PDX8_9BACT|nr:protein of unknown function [Nitrospira defluvii]
MPVTLSDPLTLRGFACLAFLPDRQYACVGPIERSPVGLYVHLWFGVAMPPRPAISDRSGSTLMAAPAG